VSWQPIEIRRIPGRYAVSSAPEESLITLDLIRLSDPEALRLDGNYIRFGMFPDEVQYEIVGWVSEQRALHLRQVHP